MFQVPYGTCGDHYFTSLTKITCTAAIVAL